MEKLARNITLACRIVISVDTPVCRCLQTPPSFDFAANVLQTFAWPLSAAAPQPVLPPELQAVLEVHAGFESIY